MKKALNITVCASAITLAAAFLLSMILAVLTVKGAILPWLFNLTVIAAGVNLIFTAAAAILCIADTAIKFGRKGGFL